MDLAKLAVHPRLDAFTMPVSLAWEIDPGLDDAGTTFLFAIFCVSFLFWTMDIFVVASFPEEHVVCFPLLG